MIDNNQSDKTAPINLCELEDKADETEATSFPDAQLNLDLIHLSNSNHPNSVTIAHSRGKRPPPPREPTPQQPPSKSTEAERDENPATENNHRQGGLKRGQKAKLKKIKQKYVEQYETERMLRMTLLQGQNAKPSKHHQRLEHPRNEWEQNLANAVREIEHLSTTSEIVENERYEPTEVDKPVSDDSPPTTPECHEDVPEPESQCEIQEPQEADDEEDANDKQTTEDDSLRLMETLTGQPQKNDVLLYALPVCAPYAALTNYKYKVKLTPGPIKRGKAAEKVLYHFLTDRSANPREKELLRAMKGEDESRNFPGCVKITLPQGNRNVQRKMNL